MKLNTVFFIVYIYLIIILSFFGGIEGAVSLLGVPSSPSSDVTAQSFFSDASFRMAKDGNVSRLFGSGIKLDLEEVEIVTSGGVLRYSFDKTEFRVRDALWDSLYTEDTIVYRLNGEEFFSAGKSNGANYFRLMGDVYAKNIWVDQYSSLPVMINLCIADRTLSDLPTANTEDCKRDMSGTHFSETEKLEYVSKLLSALVSSIKISSRKSSAGEVVEQHVKSTAELRTVQQRLEVLSRDVSAAHSTIDHFNSTQVDLKQHSALLDSGVTSLQESLRSLNASMEMRFNSTMKDIYGLLQQTLLNELNRYNDSVAAFALSQSTIENSLTGKISYVAGSVAELEKTVMVLNGMALTHKNESAEFAKSISSSVNESQSSQLVLMREMVEEAGRLGEAAMDARAEAALNQSLAAIEALRLDVQALRLGIDGAVLGAVQPLEDAFRHAQGHLQRNLSILSDTVHHNTLLFDLNLSSVLSNVTEVSASFARQLSNLSVQAAAEKRELTEELHSYSLNVSDWLAAHTLNTSAVVARSNAILANAISDVNVSSIEAHHNLSLELAGVRLELDAELNRTRQHMMVEVGALREWAGSAVATAVEAAEEEALRVEELVGSERRWLEDYVLDALALSSAESADALDVLHVAMYETNSSLRDWARHAESELQRVDLALRAQVESLNTSLHVQLTLAEEALRTSQDQLSKALNECVVSIEMAHSNLSEWTGSVAAQVASVQQEGQQQLLFGLSQMNASWQAARDQDAMHVVEALAAVRAELGVAEQALNASIAQSAAETARRLEAVNASAQAQASAALVAVHNSSQVLQEKLARTVGAVRESTAANFSVVSDQLLFVEELFAHNLSVLQTSFGADLADLRLGMQRASDQAALSTQSLNQSTSLRLHEHAELLQRAVEQQEERRETVRSEMSQAVLQLSADMHAASAASAETARSELAQVQATLTEGLVKQQDASALLNASLAAAVRDTASTVQAVEEKLQASITGVSAEVSALNSTFCGHEQAVSSSIDKLAVDLAEQQRRWAEKVAAVEAGVQKQQAELRQDWDRMRAEISQGAAEQVATLKADISVQLGSAESALQSALLQQRGEAEASMEALRQDAAVRAEKQGRDMAELRQGLTGSQSALGEKLQALECSVKSLEKDAEDRAARRTEETVAALELRLNAAERIADRQEQELQQLRALLFEIQSSLVNHSGHVLQLFAQQQQNEKLDVGKGVGNSNSDGAHREK